MLLEWRDCAISAHSDHLARMTRLGGGRPLMLKVAHPHRVKYFTRAWSLRVAAMPNRHPDILFLIYDSCRYDSFLAARAEYIKTYFEVHPAYAQGTYTLPSTISLYQGILPNVNAPIPLFNRFVRPLLRINHRDADTRALITFPSGTSCIVGGLSARGYRTVGTGGVGWFRHEALTSPFDIFYFAGIDAPSQRDFIAQETEDLTHPLFMLVNLGETHDPFEFNHPVREHLILRDLERQLGRTSSPYRHDLHSKQIAACEYLDHISRDIVEAVMRRKTDAILVFLSDHGECFGDDGRYGHGFYHPKVMEVPLGILALRRGEPYSIHKYEVAL